MKLKWKAAEHMTPVTMVKWSSNGDYLLSSSMDNIVILWDAKVGKCLCRIDKHKEGVTSIAWAPDGKTFYSAGLDRLVYEWEIVGNRIHLNEPKYCFQNAMLTEITVSHNGRWLFGVNDKSILMYDLKNRQAEPRKLPERVFIISICLSLDDRYLAVNLKAPETPSDISMWKSVPQSIHIWDIKKKEIVQRLSGHQQGRFVIRSDFGGCNEGFVVCGSEDTNIRIWNQKSGNLVKVLRDHSSSVNDVSWNRRVHGMLASCSDDGTIKLWKSTEK
eukprot:TRINITY_DN10202_c0_g4_i1.p1 TRINITY_DN10202_c0_g4~~TRINITY_DN10202_c0_g4_i1.p1  ORF type:complete len:274 (-),score=57.04 TRINITY_DN10202_c0_g4_i1:2-823(-)